MSMEMEKLINMLEEANIPHEVVRHWSGTPQVFYPSKSDSICDVVSFNGSYGGDEGYLEIMGLVDSYCKGDNVQGYLTAEEVFARIKKDYTHFSATYTYVDSATASPNHTSISYIIGHLPTIKYVKRHKDLQQITTDNETVAKVLDFLIEQDLMIGWKEMTIDEVLAGYYDDEEDDML